MWLVHTTVNGALVADALGYPVAFDLEGEYGRDKTPQVIEVPDEETALALADLIQERCTLAIVTNSDSVPILHHDCYSAENTVWIDHTSKRCTICNKIWYLRDIGM